MAAMFFRRTPASQVDLAVLGNAVVQVGAIALVHARPGFFGPQGFEFNLTLLAVALALVIAGAGRFSLDPRLAGRRGARTRDGEPLTGNR